MNSLEAFFIKLGDQIVARSYEHLILTFLSMLIASCIAIPLGVFLSRYKSQKLVAVIMGLVNIVQPIPSLALIAFVIAFFKTIGFPTIGTTPGMVALVVYALLPILRNTYTGIRQVDPAVKEVAVGMGMMPRQVLFTVEFPLALPVIMAGIRVSTVWTIGVATLVSLVGAGGLGDLIFKGLRSYHMDLVLAGAAPASAMALLFDWFLGQLEKGLTPAGMRSQNKKKLKRQENRSLYLKITSLVVIFIMISLILKLLTHEKHSSLQAGFDSEFLVRPDGYQGLIKTYNLHFKSEPKHMDPGLMYKACGDGAVDVICGFATDGRIHAYNLFILEDDKHFFPSYYAAPLIRSEIIQKMPELKQILNRLANKISNEKMQRLNYQVDEKNRTAADVALEFLNEQKLLGSQTALEDPIKTIRLGGKNFTEQEILGEIMAILIESNSDIQVERKLNLGGTMICFNAMIAADLDLYPEYTGTGLVNILKQEVVSDPDKTYQIVSDTFAEQFDLIWLKPFGFNNMYTLTMRKKHAKKLGIKTISDLTSHLHSRN